MNACAPSTEAAATTPPAPGGPHRWAPTGKHSAAAVGTLLRKYRQYKLLRRGAAVGRPVGTARSPGRGQLIRFQGGQEMSNDRFRTCRHCGGPRRADGSLARDPFYFRGGLCYECHIARELPPDYACREGYRPMPGPPYSAATCRPPTGKRWLDDRGRSVRDQLLMLRRRPRW